MGRFGCGVDCHVRELDGGLRVARGESLCDGESWAVVDMIRRGTIGARGATLPKLSAFKAYLASDSNA